MTEPSLLAASISMKEDAFRRFIASKPANAFAEAAAGIIVNGEDDFLAIRYLKKEGALFAAYIFRWGDRADEIMEHPCFKALLGACNFMEGDERGRVLISPGALNFLSDGIEAAFVLAPGTSARADDVTKAEMARFDRLLNKHIFESGMGPASYPYLITSPKIFPTKLRKKTEALLEKHRARLAKERIPSATPLNPVRLFGRYYYNGHFLIYAKPGRLRPLVGLDPLSLRQRPRGASDANHVVIDGHIVTTDPKTFKVHVCEQGRGTTFYTDANHVYGPNLTAIPGSDPGSFTLVDAGFFRDRAHWYAWDGTALTDVGTTARIDKSLHYLPLCLLTGSDSIYIGSTRLAMDASSFEIKRTKVSASSRALAWFSDKAGDAIVLCLNDMSGKIVFHHTDDPERLWEKLERGGEEKDSLTEACDTLPRADSAALDDPQGRQNLVAAFESWLETNFEQFHREHSHVNAFWSGINDYFYACWHLKAYQKIIDLYRKISDDAWRKPYIFHHTACAFVATGNMDQAVWEVRNALIYGYNRIDDLLVDPDIAPLFEREDFQSLKTYREQTKNGPGMLLPPELLQRLNAIDLEKNRHILNTIPERFTIPNEQIISLAFADHPDGEKPYRDALATFINSVARVAWQAQHFSLARKLYQATVDMPDLTPTTHLIVAIERYQEGFSCIDITGNDTEPREEFRQAAAALGRMQSCLADDREKAADPLWAEVSTNDLSAPFVAMAQSGDAALIQFWRENGLAQSQ